MNNRIEELRAEMAKKKLDTVLVYNEFNVRAITGIECDNACVVIPLNGKVTFYTDFRYIPMVHRVRPDLACKDIKKVVFPGKKVGIEFSMTHSRYEKLKKDHKGVNFVDFEKEILAVRAVKTPEEIEKLKKAEFLNDIIWSEAQKEFKPGMTEREMARIIQMLMVKEGDGEAFATIVCVGKNAAECHHVPDDTKWNGKEPVLVDMGVKLDGVCSDMTRNIVPAKPASLYKKIYNITLEANLKAIKELKPGMTGKQLDAIARKYITKAGFGKCFGHSLGHGVGYEIHEAPAASKKGDMVLKPGMLVTIEPGIYLEGNLGVRIEDLVLITETGCEVLSHSKK